MIIEHLDPGYHDRSTFDCGNNALNQFLRSYARQFSSRGLGITWVAVVPEAPRRIVGFYTLSMNSALPAELADPHLRVPRIPIALLGRLAIELQFQHKGYGELLLTHALYTAYQLSMHIGAYAVVVDPLEAHVASFSRKCDFTPMPGAPERLYLSIKHLAKSLGSLIHSSRNIFTLPEMQRIPAGE